MLQDHTPPSLESAPPAPPAASTARVLLEALRPHQWLKNLLVFVPLVPNLITDGGSFFLCLVGFVAMCCVASAGYVLNDLLDLADDRTHPRKRNRPFASGRLPVSTGITAVPVLLALGLGLAASASLALFAAVGAYFLATVAYSMRLKRLVLVDICTLAFLYTARILTGGIAIGVELSMWLLAFSMFIFFSLAAVKRQAELTEAEAQGTRHTDRRGYRVEDLAVVSQMAVAAGFVATLVFALYVNEQQTAGRYGEPALLWIVCPLLLFWISRMVLVAGRGEMHDDPLVYALENPASRVTIALIAAIMVAAVLL
jgi:4-hydroxybenzoate polyprenyltransferase